MSEDLQPTLQPRGVVDVGFNARTHTMGSDLHALTAHVTDTKR